MAYTHQRTEIKMLGTAGTEVVLASAAAVKTRHLFKERAVLRKFVAYPLVIGVTVTKPTITLRKVTGPASTTASGTAITGGTLTFPAAQPLGKLVANEMLHTTFDPGDQLVVHISTAATKAFTLRCSAFIEPSWERPANTASKISTVTA